MDTTTATFVWLALCCCCSSFAAPVPDRRLRQTDRVAGNPATPDRVAADATTSDQPFDPTLDALADAKYDESDDEDNGKNGGTEDREKRQLSFVQGRLLNFLKPLPVVDVTKEDEKYGNDGDKFNRIGRGFIGGVESVSNMLTSALSFPVDTAKKLSRSATEMLNNLGGRLIGLQ
ncbi:uncharacterized protein LOC111029880 [Myzus persicae]|uniref:uncharacterized protein LOC111029880 n=1 Tax=Myzus persicae TaxID=13164 RepID=UPI000B933E97|nr:uncharacterized protein LOC111029880 [Myzus persicae]